MKNIIFVITFTLLASNSFANSQTKTEAFWREYCPTVKSIKQTRELALFCKLKDLEKNRSEQIKFLREVSVITGEVRFENWHSLSLEERQQLENLESTALNISSELITNNVR